MMRGILRGLLLLLAVLTCLISFSCSEKEVFGIDYTYQMTQFIEEDLDGMELYSQDIYPDSTVTFKLDDSDDRYFYAVRNVSRFYSFDIANNPYESHLGFLDIYDAVVTIDDRFTGDVYRIRGDDTTRAYGLESNVQRFAYFLKLYGDAYQYAGWRFWAYSTLYFSPDGVFVTADNDTIPAYSNRSNGVGGLFGRLGSLVIFKQDIIRMTFGDSLSYYSAHNDRLFAQISNGEYSALYNETEAGNKYMTGWRVPSVSDNYYQLILIDSDTTSYTFREEFNAADEVVDSIMVKSGDIFIPYSLGN